MILLLVILLAASLLLNLALAASVWFSRRDRHDWGEWTEWIQDTRGVDSVRGVRYRACSHCGKVQRQSAGQHECAVVLRRRTDCPHLVFLTRSQRGRRIADLERDLGIDR